MKEARFTMRLPVILGVLLFGLLFWALVAYSLRSYLKGG